MFGCQAFVFHKMKLKLFVLDILPVKVIMDRETGRSRGFGFITFATSEDASSAIQGMDGQVLSVFWANFWNWLSWHFHMVSMMLYPHIWKNYKVVFILYKKVVKKPCVHTWSKQLLLFGRGKIDMLNAKMINFVAYAYASGLRVQIQKLSFKLKSIYSETVKASWTSV